MPADEPEARGAYERFWSGQQLDRPFLYADAILDSGLYVKPAAPVGSLDLPAKHSKGQRAA